MKTNTLQVIIIGAGTGGLCLAHGLKRAGIGVRVYERDRTRRDGLHGYRVGISPAGSQALKSCLPPELFDLFVATCARAPRHFNMLTENMSELISMPVPGSDDPVDSEKSVSRMTLRQVLLTGLEDCVVFDKTFLSYRNNEDGTGTAVFEDGSTDTGIASIGGKVALTPETRALLPDKVFHGISMIMAPKGYGSILHVMEFKWDNDGVKHGVGGNDADLITEWPGLLFDNTRDYIMWGVWGARKNLPEDPASLPGPDLARIAMKMTRDWHPDLRRLIALSDPTTIFRVNIRTSVPVSPWQSSNVTLLGDAIHTMTPGRGVGANTAMRDASLLCRRLTEVRDGVRPLVEALHAYEAEMLEYSARAVLESRKQMDANGLSHRPVLGRIQLAVMRGALRIINAVPALTRRMTDSETRLRKIDNKHEFTA